MVAPLALARGFTFAIGLCAIGWAVFAIGFFRVETPFADAAEQILANHRFSAGQLQQLRLQLTATPKSSLRSAVLNDIAMIRLELLLNGAAPGRPIDAADLAALDAAVGAALEASPSSSFMWLTEYWLGDLRGTAVEDRMKFLRMSYATGPNEAWIAGRRSPLAFGVFSGLPKDIAEAALREYEGLVRSGVLLVAAKILAGAEPPVREALRARLSQLPIWYRGELAKEMDRENLEYTLVPGIDLRPSRPF